MEPRSKGGRLALIEQQEKEEQQNSIDRERQNRMGFMLNKLKGYQKAFDMKLKGFETGLDKSFEVISKDKDSSEPDQHQYNVFEIFQEWNKIHFKYEEYWKFAGVTRQGDLNPKILQTILKDSEEIRQMSKEERNDSILEAAMIEFYFETRFYEFYGDLYKPWNVRIHPNVFKKISERTLDFPKIFPEQLIFFVVNHMLWGDFSMKMEFYEHFGYTTFFVPMDSRYYLFASINLERIPEIDSKGEEVIGHRFQQSIKILNVFASHRVNLINDGPKERFKSDNLIKNYPDKYNIFEGELSRKIFKISSYSIVSRAYRVHFGTYGADNLEDEKSSTGGTTTIYLPLTLKFNNQLVSSAYSKFKFDGEQWILKNEGDLYTAGVRMDEGAQESISDEANQNMVIKFFENMEKFGLKFSNSQKKMLVSSKNTLVIGRSGTGKTTVSAFKMVAIDLIFKAYSKSKLTGISKPKLESKDFDIYKTCGIVFCTASPVLTVEVRRFYHELNSKIKEFILKKEKKRAAKKEDTKQESSDEEAETEIIPTEEEKDAKIMQESIKIALESTKQDLEDELEEEDIQKNIPSSIYKLKSEHFP